MTQELLYRKVEAIDLVRILEREFDLTIRAVQPLMTISGNGCPLVIQFTGVRVIYEEPVAHGFNRLLARSERGQVGTPDEEADLDGKRGSVE